MTDVPLTPAIRADIRRTLSYALRFGTTGKRQHQYDGVMADAAAQHLIEALERSGFVVMRGPPAPDHAATLGGGAAGDPGNE